MLSRCFIPGGQLLVSDVFLMSISIVRGGEDVGILGDGFHDVYRLTRSCLFVRINALNQESAAVTYCLFLLFMLSVNH